MTRTAAAIVAAALVAALLQPARSGASEAFVVVVNQANPLSRFGRADDHLSRAATLIDRAVEREANFVSTGAGYAEWETGELNDREVAALVEAVDRLTFLSLDGVLDAIRRRTTPTWTYFRWNYLPERWQEQYDDARRRRA